MVCEDCGREFPGKRASICPDCAHQQALDKARDEQIRRRNGPYAVNLALDRAVYELIASSAEDFKIGARFGKQDVETYGLYWAKGMTFRNRYNGKILEY